VHIIITDAWLAKSQAVHLNGWKLITAGVLGAVALMFGAIVAYHWVFLEGVRRGWPGFEPVARLVHPDTTATATPTCAPSPVGRMLTAR